MSTAKRLKDRIALVTGASRGIGRAVAVALAREGAHVIVTGRSTGALEDLDDEIRATGGAATLLQLDLRKGDKVDQLGPTIFQRWGKLDILVGNAGMLGPLSPLAHVTETAWTAVIETNLTSNWRLIRTLDPLLQRSDAGRAVFVTSGASTGKNAYWGPYAVSKAGLDALVRTYAHEVATTRVRVNIVNPGPTRTQMRAKAFPGESPESLPHPSELGPMFVELAAPQCAFNGQSFKFRDWKAAARPAPAED
ncbi:MAG: oxidoreductase [Hyphomicrobium sp.]|nr:MAG: oxidoreductase [Hyphomicrobium sp.]